MLTSDFFPHISHGWFLDPISTLEIQRSSAPKQPLDSAESLHLDVWVIFFGRSIFFCCYLFSQSHLGKDDDWMMITLIDHLITKPLMFCLDRDGWTHTLQHAFRKFQSGFFVLALSLNYLKHLLILYNRCISVGTRKGYSLTNCDPFGRIYTMSACSFKNLSYILNMRYRWWCPRDSWDAVLFIAHCPCRCRRPTTVQSSQAPDS